MFPHETSTFPYGLLDGLRRSFDLVYSFRRINIGNDWKYSVEFLDIPARNLPESN